MNSLEEIIGTLTSWLNGHAEINSVTKGDPNELDVLKATKFPVGHIFPESTIIYEGYTTHQIRVWLLGQDHWDDLYRLHRVAQELMTSISRGALFDAQMRTGEPIAAESMYDFGQNRLYGWEIVFGLNMPNNVDNCA